MGANKLKLQKKLGKRCPECGALLEIVASSKNSIGFSQVESLIKCPSCDYSEKKSKHKRDYIRWNSEED